MAYPAVQAGSTTNFPTSGSAAPAKPANLAVGDILMACVIAQDAGTTVGFTTPTGWTKISEDINGHGGMAIFGKIADAADVAASTFTFVTSAARAGAGLSRITTDNPSSIFEKVSHANALTTPGFTPDTAGGLFLIFVASEGGGLRTAGTYAIANNNPASWSEAYDAGVSDGAGTRNAAMASAYRGVMTATGAATAVLSGATDQSFISIVSIVPARPTSFAILSTIGIPTLIEKILVAAWHVAATLNLVTQSGVAPKWRNLAKRAQGNMYNQDKS